MSTIRDITTANLIHIYLHEKLGDYLIPMDQYANYEQHQPNAILPDPHQNSAEAGKFEFHNNNNNSVQYFYESNNSVQQQILQQHTHQTSEYYVSTLFIF